MFLQANPNAPKAAISEATEIKGIVLHNLLKKMEKEELIVSEGNCPDMVFNLKNVEE